MSENTASALTDMMKNVVDEGTGTGANLSSAGVQVAGKTGTAETGVANLTDAWFIGFAPADDPVIAVAVVIEGTGETGGVVSAPIAAAVMRAAIEDR
jgi:peptidoglycan glycosyltransferase